MKRISPKLSLRNCSSPLAVTAGILFTTILSPCVSADVVDFDSLTTLDPLFINPPFANNSTLTDGVGIGGSKGLAYANSLVGGASDLRIYMPVVLHPDTPSWEISILYKSETPLSLGFPMIGVLGTRHEPGSPGGFTIPERTEPALFAIDRSNSLDLFGSYGSYLSSANEIPSYDSQWRKFSMRVDYRGTTSRVINTYDIHVGLSYADAAGGPGPLIAELDHSLSTVQYQLTSDLYGFFGIDTPNYPNWSPGFSGAIDNFVVSVPEPTSLYLLTIGAVLVFARRRKQS